MIIIAHKDTKTGNAINEILKRAEECRRRRLGILTMFEVEKFTDSPFSAFGGIHTLVFEKEPCMKTFKKDPHVKNGYTPRVSTKEGKIVKQQLDSLPKISLSDWNSAVGFNSITSQVGYLYKREQDVFVIRVRDDWDFKIPDDCYEVTKADYELRFGS